MARLGDIATYVNGYAFKPSDWSDTGLPIIRIQDLTGNSYQANRYGNLTKKAVLGLLLEGSIDYLRFSHLLHPVVRSFIFVLYVLHNLIKLCNLYQIRSSSPWVLKK